MSKTSVRPRYRPWSRSSKSVGEAESPESGDALLEAEYRYARAAYTGEDCAPAVAELTAYAIADGLQELVNELRRSEAAQSVAPRNSLTMLGL